MKRFAWTAAALASLAAPCAAAPAPSAADAPRPPPLRLAIAPFGKWIGTAAAYQPLQSDPNYAGLLAEQFSMLTPENAMKFSVVHPRPGADAGSFDFAQGDALVEFARAHGMKVRGHALVWHDQIPDWVTHPFPSDAQLVSTLQGHVAGVVGHYRGKLYSWDVVNEAVDSDGTMRATLWSSLGPEYVIASAFRWARAADPNVKLFYNDYGAESSPTKADAIYELLQTMKASGVPVDGVGFQMHLSADKTYGDFSVLLKRFAGLGLEVQITEFDVNTDGSPAQLQVQASLYARGLKACLAEPKCTAFVTWGFTDKYGPRVGQAPLMLDASYRPKPAYDALEQALFPR